MAKNGIKTKNDFSKLREKAEKKLKRLSLSESEHELSVHKEELEMQAHELRSTQIKLLKSLEEYTQLFNLVPVGYFVLDKQGFIINLNSAALKLVGMDYQQLKGKAFSVLLNGVHFQDDYYRYRRELSDTEVHQRIESELRRKDGKVLSVLIESTIVKNEKKQFKHLLCTVVDISERKEQELMLKDALIKERELGNMKSRFVSMASHEFRTPLSAIQTSTDIIGMHIRKNDTANCEKHILRIGTSVKHLTDILNDFLSLDKLENGEIKITKIKINVKKLIAEMIREIELLLKKGQAIEYIFDGNTESKIDPKILRSILLNLLSNASKYSAEGSKIELKVLVTVNQIKITVKDYGIGIPTEEQEKIFTRLFRAKNAEMVEGTGLGLNILKKYVELLSGNISFTSKENAGSTFEVKIPA